MKTNFQTIDKHYSVLIVGTGATNKYLYEVVQPEYQREAFEVFGASSLTEAYNEFVDGMHNISDIYLLNIETKYDYTKIGKIVAEYDFSYIVPVDVLLSDSYFDPNKNGKRTYYLQDMIELSGEENNSVFIVTDKSASLYQTIDLFLKDMIEVQNSFKNIVNNNFCRENVMFVANNLSGTEYANVILARMITNSRINEYPKSDIKIDSYGTVYDMDYTDSIGSMIYFRSHADGSITAENLLNFAPDNIPTKIFTIYRICLYIAKELDFSDYIGSYYTAYKKQQIENIVTNYLSSITGSLITEFKINQVYAEENPYHPGTVNVILKYSIKPIVCAERFITQSVRI